MNGRNYSKLLAASMFAAIVTTPLMAEQASSSDATQPVVVELFTSEGCSSCPPADRVAIDLQKDLGSDVIVLSEHVDYWNYLGWQDPYSAPLFTSRQHDYAKKLGQQSVYTPEAIVDGTFGMVGSGRGNLKNAIEKASRVPKVRVSISSSNAADDASKKELGISAIAPSGSSGTNAQLFIAVTENNLRSNVRSGENGGSVLEHTGVVRYLHKVGESVKLEDNKQITLNTEVRLDPRWKKQDLRIVAFFQDVSSRAIRGANQIKVN
jgi:hypothetical protein